MICSFLKRCRGDRRVINDRFRHHNGFRILFANHLHDFMLLGMRDELLGDFEDFSIEISKIPTSSDERMIFSPPK